MRFVRHLLVLSFVMPAGTAAQTITAAGKPARLDIRVAGEASIRVTLAPLDFNRDFPQTPAVVDRTYAPPSLSLRQIERPVRRTVGSLDVEVRPQPLTLVVRNRAGKLLQQLVFDPDGNLSFQLDDQPVLGMGEGGPRPAPGRPWREQPVQFDRRGHLDTMEPRWQSDMYGSRNPVAMLLGTSGWGLFVATPWVQVDLHESRSRRFPSVEALRVREPAADGAQPAAEPGQGTSAGQTASFRGSTTSSSSTRTIRSQR